MDPVEYRHRRQASLVTALAHIFGLVSIVLLLVWLLHYREGIDIESYDPVRIFNVHPFLMFFGFIFMAGEAMLAYKTIAGAHEVRKFVHMLFHLIAIILGIVGIHAAFKFHDRRNIFDMYSLHSWIGIVTFCLFILQWFFGLATFMFPTASTATRAMALPWHVSFGRALLYMAICTAETGLMQKVTFMGIRYDGEIRLVNFLAFSILLFGVTVDLSVTLGRYV